MTASAHAVVEHGSTPLVAFLFAALVYMSKDAGTSLLVDSSTGSSSPLFQNKLNGFL
jgi:hypothetical protein